MPVTTNREVFEKLKDGVATFDIDEVQRTAKAALDAGFQVEEIVSALRRGLEVVGEKYEAGEFFMTELIMAGETMKEAMKVVEPYIKMHGVNSLGRIVIGTVQGDIHDIGKNIVIALLKATGFEITDLGIDVATSKFIDEVKNEVEKTGKSILGLSALLSVSMPEMEVAIKELKQTGLRHQTKVIVGGAVITEEFGKNIEADAACRDAVKGVEICKAWS
jgi:5-methyltetrahydrofolate--homocysteine methyltransferase